jgi:hypothetical protein
MKHLRQYIRRILLTEAAITPGDLHRENAVVYIAQGYGDGMEIYYATREDVEPMESADNLLLGTVYINSFDYDGRCGGGWMVTSSEAKSGWGPLLYDVAMEYATMNGGGLFPDRGSVSQSARKVWDYYLNKRPDVTAHQLDDPMNSLTPVEEDNCDQEVAGGFHYQYSGAEEPENPDWMISPLSKRYTKSPTTINKLKQLGLLVEL